MGSIINESHPKKQLWQIELSQSFRQISDLLDYCEVSIDDIDGAQLATKQLRFFVTKSWADRIEKGNIQDPLLLQVLPSYRENQPTAGFTDDPLQEQTQNPIPGLIHKYHGRALVTVTQQCAIYCRYCFRRAFPYSDNRISQQNWQRILDYLHARTDIEEIILSGGDPLILTNHHLQQIIDDLVAIPQLRYLRIHSRIPIVLPSRMTDDLWQTLGNNRLQVALVVHCNHPQEIDYTVRQAVAAAKQYRILLLNQSVLLKGINNDPSILAELSHTLYAAGILPYYLHKLDKIQGGAHFALSEQEEQYIVTHLLKRLPGYLMPKFVAEIPHAGAKIPIPLNITNQASNTVNRDERLDQANQ